MIQKKSLFVAVIIILFIGSAYTTLVPSNHIGQRFILSLPETNNKKTLQSWLSATKPAGVMLLASHFQNRAKTKSLICFLQEEAKQIGLPPLLVTVDWEGGIVSRPHESGGFHTTPSPWALCQAGPPACFLAGMLIGTQLRSIGVNMDFAPSLDLYGANNPILATRCFSDSPEKTAECGIAFAQGLMSQGVWPVIKHFPGLGMGAGDTHVTSVGITSEKAMLEKHMLPFDKSLQAKIPCVMSTHAVFSHFGDEPVTLCKKAVDYLKAKNSNVLCITDDFSMKAVNPNNSPDDAIFKSLKAGYHLIIFSGKADVQIALIDSCQKKYAQLQTSAQQHKTFDLQHNFIKTFKSKRLTQTSQEIKPAREKKIAQFLAKRCLQQQTPFPKLDGKNITMLTANLPIIRPPEKWFIQENKSYLHKKLEDYGCPINEIILDPKNHESPKHVARFIATHRGKTQLIVQTFFYADNIWNTIQRKWLEQLKPFQKNLIIISLGHPLEQKILPSARIINCGSFHEPILDVVAQGITNYAKPALTGADQLTRNPACWLAKKRFGLVCHRCSTILRCDSKEHFLPTVLHSWALSQNNSTNLAAIFCPEHGLLGTAEAFAHVDSAQTSEWRCPVYSLHGTHKKPTPEMLKNIDVLVIDLQDVGTRCFTYLSTLQLALEAAAENNIEVLVLDRPNPLAFWGSQGPMLEKKYESFVGKVHVPFLHGTTMGELAKIINTSLGCKLSVLECENCDHDFFFTRPFIAPSPNLCSIDHIFAYPVTVFLEGTNYSEGRGTPWPFMQFGAPWVNGSMLAKTLNNKQLPGVYFQPTSFTPQKIAGVAENPKHRNIRCEGVFIHIYDHEAVKPMQTARVILDTLFARYPQQSQWITWGRHYGIDLLVGNDSWRNK